MSIYYFAYGSNLSSARIRQPDRAPGAGFVSTAVLEHHVLRFHKRSVDGSGKCDVWRTGFRGDRVHGVLWEISHAEALRLDRIEGVGRGYERVSLEVATTGGQLGAVTYVAQETFVDPGLLPYAWYKALVVAGAREHGLPGEWIAFLESFDTWRDQDEARARQARAILGSGSSRP